MEYPEDESDLYWNFSKIPFKEYEKDMETKLSKDKKKEILDLFMNYNNLHSKKDFDEIKENLHDACRKGDLELIKIYLGETFNSNNFTFKLDKTNQTASLFYVNDINENAIIPRSVQHRNADYLITSVCGIGELTKTVKFVEDSAVKTIYKNTFSDFSHIQEIHFPASLKELKEGWCCNTSNLNKIQISPLNGHFIFKDDKYLLGKSDECNDEFDILLFASRNIDEISIPSNIKIISSYAFQNCSRLLNVEIPENSNLQIIGSDAFSGSIINEIYFPASLKELKEGWCYNTSNLNEIKISPLNGQFIFKDDKYLLGKSDECNDFDILLFVSRKFKKISIPSNIRIISSFTLQNCRNLSKVEIQKNSNLQIIEKYAFSSSAINEIYIPSKVSKICKNAFSYCEYLINVEIPTNSNLQTIEDHAFSESNIKKIFIPPNVTKISEYAFSSCQNIENVEISKNSNLQIIEKDAFSFSNLKAFFIPSSVSEICKYAFDYCQNLQIIEISDESKLESFPFPAFTLCPQFMIMIPSSLKKIVNYNSFNQNWNHLNDDGNDSNFD